MFIDLKTKLNPSSPSITRRKTTAQQKEILKGKNSFISNNR